MILYQYPPLVTTFDTSLLAKEAKQDTQITELQGINTELNTQTSLLTDIETNTGNALTDTQLRATPPSFKLSDGTDTADIVALGTQVATADKGLVVNSVIHGLTTAGGGNYVDVKVNPSGALTVESTVSSSALPTGAATSANQTTTNTKLDTLIAKDYATQTTLSNVDSNVAGINNKLGQTLETEGAAAGTAGVVVGGKDESGNYKMFALDSATGNLKVQGSFAAGVPSAVTVKQANITVGTSAVRLTTDAAAPSSTRQRLSFRPLSTSTAKFYYGSSGVTTSNGVEVFPGESIDMVNDANDYYIISDTAAQSVRVVEAE